MNENTKASSRPRSVKRKKRTGFTMMEMMITLAIMAILFGLAVPAVAQIQKNLEIARLNSYAKDVYLAAQNRLTSLKATGELVELRDTLQNEYSGEGLTGKNRYYGPSDPENMEATSFKPQDWNDDWDAGSAYKKYFNFYGIMHNPTDAADNDVIVDEIIPELSVTSTSLDHHYYIEFNPTTGDVYAAFYTDAKGGFTAQDIRDLPYAEAEGEDNGRSKAYLRDEFKNYNNEKMMVGYYRGDPTDMLEDKEITEYDVTCELVNKEDLYVKVTCDLGDTYFLRKFIEASVTVADTATGNSIEIPLNLAAPDSLRTYDRSMLATTNNYVMFGYDSTDTTKFVAYILLDALDTANVMNGTGFPTVIEGLADTYSENGNNLTALVDAVKAGCNLKATADVELDFADRIVRTNTESGNQESEIQNSRFAAISSSEGSKTVNVGYVRHLKNLDGYQASGTELKVEQSCVEYIVETYIDETTGEEKTRRVENTKGDIYFNSNFTLEGGDTKWYWDSDYLIGEPTGSFLRNYLNAPAATDEAYITPITCGTTGNFKNFTYNGKHYGLYDFVIAGDVDDENVGLFGTLKPATKGIIKDTNLIDATVDGSDAIGSVGGLVGEAENCEFNNVGVRLTDRDPVQNKHYANMASRVENLKVSSEEAELVGGMVGTAKNCSFDYSYAAVQVEGAHTAGGLVGWSLNSKYQGCYTSEPTIGTVNVGGFIGLMEGGSAEAEQNGNSVYPIYATGDVIGSGNVGGFVGTAKGGAVIDGCNSFGRARATDGDTTTKPGGFVGNAVSGTSFSNNSYLKQTRYNQGSTYKPQDGFAIGRGYNDEIFYNGDSYWNVMGNESTANKPEDSHPYTVYNRATVFPFAMTCRSMDEGYDEIPHYGDWPVEASIQTMLAYYEVYKNDDGSESIGLYGYTSLVGETAANNWQLNTLQTGDTYCIEDGYAIVSTDVITKITGTIDTLGTTVSLDFSAADENVNVDFVSEGSSRSEGVHVYKLNDLDAQGMSTAYQTRMNGSSGTYFQKAVLTGLNGAEEVFTDYTFFYCPVLAKSSINPSPAQADDPSLCPTVEEMESTSKPAAGIIRSARQLNAMGRMNWFWNMNLNQECHVDFGQYVKTYCGENIDLSATGQTASNAWRNKPIGTNVNGVKKPYTGAYNGCSFKIIDYCLQVSDGNTDSLDAGLFGLLYKGSIKNVVLMASDPNANDGAGTAWVKSTMINGGGAYHIAPLVGAVEYNKEAYGSASGTARSLKAWNISGDSIDKYAIEGNKFNFVGYNNTGDGGKWSNVKSQYVPQNTQQYMTITLKGEFGTVSSASLVATKTINGSPVTYATANATGIKDGEITFVLQMNDCYLETTPETVNPDTGEVTPASSKRNIGDDIAITLNGGDLTNWTVANSGFTAELFSTEPVVPTGDDPASYITGIANMSTVSNCAVAGYIVDYVPGGTQNQEVQIGGLVGKNQGEIYNCSAANKRLSATGSSGSNVRYIGGFAGVNKEGIIANCYSGGDLVPLGTQPAFVGGVVGQQQKDSTAPAWCTANTKLLDSYSYCTMKDNSAATFAGVANGSESMILHSHFLNDLGCFKDYSQDNHPFTALYNKLIDKDRVYNTTIRGEDVTIPYSMTPVKLKQLGRGSAFALSGDIGKANFDHSWPYDLSLAGEYPFAAVVMDDDGYYVHYGDWPNPNGSLYTNTASFGGVYWSDFCVDATFKTDYNYYWGDWLKEMKYQIGLGDFKEGDYIEIIIEPEFKWDAPEAAGLLQCGVHSMMENTGKNIWDDENDVAYEAQGINFSNGQVYQFVFDVDKATLNILNDPQLWFAVNYHEKGGIDGHLWETVKGNYTDPDDGSPAGNEDPFRLNRLTVNIYRDSSTSKTENTTTRRSTTSSQQGATTSEEDVTHLETLKTWDFEPVNGVAASNILSTDKGPMVAGVIAENTDVQATGHSNKITLSSAESFIMDISDAFNNEPELKKNECYQVEATFALGPGATDDMSMRPYLVSGDDKFYASNYTLVQKRSDTGANAGKTIWASALYTFGTEGVTIDDDAYIVWIPRDAGKTLTGDLYVDNLVVKKVAQGADPTATSSTKATIPAEEEAKLIAYWSTNSASDISAPTYQTTAKNNYRYINFQSAKDLTSNLTWSQFVDHFGVLSDTQYLMVTLNYSDDYAHAEKANFTFTCDSLAYIASDGNREIVNEIDPASGDDSFDAESRTVKWIIGGPLDYSDLYKYRDAAGDGKQLNLRSFITYRNQYDLTDNRVLTDNKDDFTISIGIYDRDPNASAMTVPTTTVSQTTRQLSGGTAVHTFASDALGTNNYMTFGGGDVGYVDGNRSTIMTWNEFVNMVGVLTDRQYVRVTLTNTDAPFGTLDLASQTIQANAYRGVDGKIIKNEKAKSVNSTTVVYQINGPLSLNSVATDGSKEGYNDAGMVFGGMSTNAGELRVGDKTSILVEIMSTATTAQLQGDSFDVLANDIVTKTATITLSGDTFNSTVTTGNNITTWFNGLGGRGLTANVAAVNGNVLTVNIVGTVTEAPATDVTVTAVVPGTAMTQGGSDVTATGSFVISKKEPKASIVGDETIRSFFVNELIGGDLSGHPNIVDVNISNTAFTSNFGSVGDWYTGTLPAGMALAQVAKKDDSTVTLTFSGTPTEQSDSPITIVVPSFANTSGQTLTAGTITLKVVSRPKVDAPTFNLPEGEYRGARSVAISCSTVDATVKYKINDGAWMDYVSAILLEEGETTVYARAEKEGCITSDEVHATYTITHDDNLIKNGYFDDGMDGWTVNPASTDVKVVNGVLTVTDYQAGNVLEIVASLKDGVTLKPNTKYRLSFNMNADTGMTVKLNPGGNNSISYTESGSYEFETGPSSEMGKFKVYISAPKDKPAVSGTFDNFVLAEVGGTEPSTPTETSSSQTEPSVTSQPESSAAESSTTSTVPGERTLVAKWETKAGISYGYFYDGVADAVVYDNNVGTSNSNEIKWSDFVTYLVNNDLLTSDAYLEIVYEGGTDAMFQNAQAANATLSNVTFGISGLKAKYADDVKLVFQTAKGLTYTAGDGQLAAKVTGVTSGWGSGAGKVTVSLYTGSTGGETSESESSASESSETSTSETSGSETYTNLIVNGNFANGLNGWTQNVPAEGDYAGFFTVSGGALHVDIPTYRSVSLAASYTEPLKPSTEYTLGVDMTTSGSANDKIAVRIKKDNNHSETMTSTGTVTFTTPSDLTNFQISVTVAGDSNGLETAVIDNFILVEGDHIPDIDDPNPPVTETYTVTVTGGNADKTTGVAAGETVTLTPPTTAPEGKEFTGWRVTSGGVTVTNNQFTMPAANVTIEAVYSDIEYTISVLNGNSNGVAKAVKGTSIQINADTPQEGKHFTGWTVTAPAGLTVADASASMTTFTMPAANVEIQATYDWDMHNIIVKSNNNTWGTASVVGGATTGHYTEQITLQVSPASGYEFTGWSVKNGLATVGTDNKFLMPNTEVEITANFAKIVVPTHTVTITGGIVTGKTGLETIAEGENVSITASNPDTGYAFTGWTVTTPSGLTLVDASASVTSFTMPQTDVKITANFAKVDYTVSCNAVQNGTIKVNNAASATANYGDTVTLTATPNTGYVFAGWSVSGGTLNSTNANPATLTVPAANVTVSATFEKQSYNITVNNDTNKGTVSVPASAQYGDTVTLSVTPKTGWKFDSWTVNAGGVTVTNNTFTMPANAVTLTANYTADTSVAIASWTTSAGASEVSYQNGTASVKVSFNNVGADGKSFSAFMNGLSDLGSNQYMKVTYTKSNGKFGNARRAATTLDMKALSGGTRKVAFADDTTIVAYVVGAATKTTDTSFTTSWTNASAVPAAADVTVTVEVYNFTTSPIAGLDETDVTKAYTVTVVDGTASPASTAANNTVTVTAATKSGYEFTGWTVDATDYLWYATAHETDNQLTFTMPYNNVKLTANYEVAETEPTQPTPSGNLIKNGDFSNGTADWEKACTTFEVTGGVASISDGHNSGDKYGISQAVNFIVGHSYTFSCDITMTKGSAATLYVNSSTNDKFKTDLAGHYSVTFEAVSGMDVVKIGGSDVDFTIDNISLIDNTAGGDTPTEPIVTDPIVTDPVVGDTVTLTVSGNYKPGQYDAETPIDVSPAGTTTFTKGSTAIITVFYAQAYDPSSNASDYLTLTVNGSPLTASGIDITTEAGHNHDVTITYSIPMDANKTVEIVSRQANYKKPVVTVIGGTSGGGDTPTQATTEATTQPQGSDYTLTLGGQYKTGKYSADVADLPSTVFNSSSLSVTSGKTVTIVIALDPVYKGSSKTAAEMAEMFSVTVDSGAAVSASYQANADNTIVGTFTFTMPSANTGVSILVSHPDYHAPTSITIS